MKSVRALVLFQPGFVGNSIINKIETLIEKNSLLIDGGFDNAVFIEFTDSMFRILI